MIETFDKNESKKSGTSATFLHRGMLVSFRSLDYIVQHHSTKKDVKLLDNVNGYLRPGELVALMGPSGCGKTTLLDVLAGRKTVGKVSGDILFGGVKPSKQFLRRYVGYVEQFDTLVPILTVEEMLRYTVELKLELGSSEGEKDARIAGVIKALGLEPCKDVLIGSPMARGISGGQAKRVNIGIALITNPRVLMLDEPTTGLDSFTSNEVMDSVKSLSMGGITVVTTLHSPTPWAFSQLDRLLILLKGRVIYFGHNGEDAVKYFTTVTKSIETNFDDERKSVAEWITDITVVADRTGKAKYLADQFSKSEQEAHAEHELEIQLSETKELPKEVAAALAVKKETTVPSWYALRTLIKYRMSKNYRRFEFYANHVAPWLVQTLIMFSAFWAVAETVDRSSVPNIVALIFFVSVSPIFSAASYIPSVVLARPLYFRERSDGLYRPIVFLLYLMLEESLIGVPVTLLATMAIFKGMYLAGSFMFFWLTFYVMYLAGITVAYAIASFSPDMLFANAAVPTFGVLTLFFSGFLIRLPDMGWWWRWYAYINPGLYAVGGQLNNFFSGDRNIAFPNDNQTVVSYFGVDFLPSKWAFFGVQLAFPVVYAFLAWLGLSYKNPVKR